MDMDLITYTGGVLDAQSETPFILAAQFAYFVDDPLAIELRLSFEVTLPCGDISAQTQYWGFGRDLLDEAFSRPGEVIGTADVKVSYHQSGLDPVMETLVLGHEQVCLQLLDNEENLRHLWMPAQPIVDFVIETAAMVPIGTERPDVDGAIERLLDGTYEA